MNELTNNPERRANRARRTENPGGKLKIWHCNFMAIGWFYSHGVAVPNLCLAPRILGPESSFRSPIWIIGKLVYI